MKKIILIGLFALSSIGLFSQVSRSRLKIPAYSWINRQVPIQQYLDSTFKSFWNIVDDGTPLINTTGWALNGNAITTNTNFIGPTTNRSLLFKTNNIQRMKLDSTGIFNWNMGSSGSPLYYNTFSLRPLPTFTQIPCLYLGVVDYRADNYALLSDTINMIYNANRGWFARCHNFSWMQAYTSFINNQSGNADGIQINGVNTVTMTSNGVTTAHMTILRKLGSTIVYSVGTVTTERGVYLQGDIHNPMPASTATITEDIGTEITHPTAGAGLTQTNRLGLGVLGHTNIWGKIWVSGQNGARSVTTPTAFIQVGAQTNTSPHMQFTSGTILTTTLTGALEFAGNIFYLTNNINRYQAGLVLTNTAVLNFGNTNAQLSADLTIAVVGAAVGDAVSIGLPAAPDANSSYTGWVSATDVVTIRFNNYSAGAIDPASATFKATVIKN